VSPPGIQAVGRLYTLLAGASAEPPGLANPSRQELEQTLSKRLITLLGSVALAVVLAAGTAWGEGTSLDDQIVEAPLVSTEAGATFVPDEVVVRTRRGGYQTRSVGAQSLAAVKQAANNIKSQDPSVEEAGPNYIYKPQFVPNDPKYNPDISDMQNWLRTIKAPSAWNDSKGTGVRIGIVDTGWQTDHPDLINDAGSQHDLVAEPEDQVAEDYGYHGTAVAGIAAADTNNSLGVAGAGFNARFLMAKACTDVCITADTADAIDWLAQNQGVKIINLSFGHINTDVNPDQLLGDAIQRAQAAGALVVASAGNDGVDTDTNPYYPACFPGVLGVGATDPTGNAIAGYSNTGSCVDLVAPGDDVGTTFNVNYAINGTAGYRYAKVGGTSFSAPQVAGTAALIRARNADLTAQQIANRLQSKATAKDYGYSLLNAKCSVNPSNDGC
jgi:subtilisin family serine protease